MDELARTRSCESDTEPTLFLAAAGPNMFAGPDEGGALSPRGSGSPVELHKLQERLDAASFRREEAIGELRRRCGQHVQRARAVSARKKKERELTIQEKRAVAERVMEAATRRRDAILLQRAQCTDSPQPSLAERCAEQLATEVADAVIEHALLDQRMLRASALHSREDSPDLVRRRRDRARQTLAAQMGLASRRKAALASQQDRAAANRARIAKKKAEKLRKHSQRVDQRRQQAQRPRTYRSKRPAHLTLSVPASTNATTDVSSPTLLHIESQQLQMEQVEGCTEALATVEEGDPPDSLTEGTDKPDKPARGAVQRYSPLSDLEAAQQQHTAATTETDPSLGDSTEHHAARVVQAAWFRFLVRRDLSRSSRSLHRLLGASLQSADFEQLTDLLQQSKIITKAMGLLTHASIAAAMDSSRSTVKPKVMPASRRKARSFMAAFLIATQCDACFGLTESVEPPRPRTEIEDLTHTAAKAVVAAFVDLLNASRKAGGAAHDSPAGRYRVLNRAVVRSQHAIDSAQLGTLEPGQTVQVIEVIVDAAGRIRALCSGKYSGELWRHGWVSVENSSGGVLLERCAGTVILPPLAARLVAAFRCFESRFDAWRSNDNARLMDESIAMVVEMERLRIYWNDRGPNVSEARAELERGIVQIGGVEAQTRLADAVAEVQSSYIPRDLGQPPQASSISPGQVGGAALFQPPPSPLEHGHSSTDHDQTVRRLMEETALDDHRIEGQSETTEESPVHFDCGTVSIMDEMDNLRLAHELQINPGQFHLPGMTSLTGTPTMSHISAEEISTEQDAMASAIEKQARRAFWSILLEQLGSVPTQYDMLLGLLDEAFHMLKSLAPESSGWVALVERCDMQLLRQQADHGAVDSADLLGALAIAMDALCVGGTEEAEDEARAWSTAALEALNAAAAERGLMGIAVTLPCIFEGFYERLEAVKEATAAFRLQPALDALAAHGAEYERAAFEREYPVGSDLPRTRTWLNGTAAPARDVGASVAAGVARVVCADDQFCAETLAETLALDAERLELLHEQAGRLAVVASVGLLVKQALTKIGVPLKLIAQVVDEPALAARETQDGRASAERLTPREETVVPILRTGRAGFWVPPTTATFVSHPREEDDDREASPIARRMLPDIFHLLEPPAPPEDSVLTVIDGGCGAVCAQAGVEWSDKDSQALHVAARAVLTGNSAILRVMKKRLDSALATSLSPNSRVADMVPEPDELKKHGLLAVALPLVSLATACRAVVDHQVKVHGGRLAAILAAQ